MMKIIGIAAVTALTVSIGTSFASRMFEDPVPKFASVDLNKLMAARIEEYKKMLEKGEVIPEADAQKYGDALNMAMKQLGDDYDVIVLNAPAVIDGVEDYTDKAQDYIQSVLNKAK